MQTPHTQPGTWPDIGVGRFAASIARGDASGCRVALVGLADDLGVRLNNGRPGAAEGPTAFRAALARFGTAWDAESELDLDVKVFDAGDVTPAPGNDAAALHKTHTRVTEALTAVHAAGMVPVCVGGGHDLTFPAVRALALSQGEMGGAVGGINVDAHLDVRETVGSGMPFRALIEGGFLDARKFTVVGAGLFANTREHHQWLTSRGARVLGVEGVMEYDVSDADTFARTMRKAAIGSSQRLGTGFVSIDLDSMDASCAPGVSAMNPMGLSVRQVEQIARRAGEHPAVKHFDLMELSPPNDRPAGAGMTARIAALLFLSFIRGFAERAS
ncbi:MAG: formimidoylglutamase [Planctomycetes bacterium]|nr:formimidoylglutamase [Planctomycetota bacterium]